MASASSASSSAIVLFNPSIDTMIDAWLHAKAQRSHSEMTVKRYRDAITAFRLMLHSRGIDLDGDTTLVSTLAQGWAAQGKVRPSVSPATYNQRLAVLGSFYAYVIRQGMFRDKKKRLHENPITRIERGQVQPYANARALSYAKIRAQLAAIDTGTLEGRRDLALLWLALTIGRRVSELAAMCRDDLTTADDGVCITIHFPRTKGGKQAYNTLTPYASALLRNYLRLLDELLPHHDAQAVWVSLSPHHRGGALGARSLERICDHRIGTQHFHALRHTAAHAMEQAGAKISEIQAFLGHSNIATTGRYLTSLSSDVNPYAEAIESLFREEPAG